MGIGRKKPSRKAPNVVFFEIPSVARPVVVGPRGNHIKTIQKEHNVRIQIGRRRLKSGTVYKFDVPMEKPKNEHLSDIYCPNVKVLVEGAVEDCQNAKAQIIKEAETESAKLPWKARFPRYWGGYRMDPRVLEDVKAKCPDVTLKKIDMEKVIIEGTRKNVLECYWQFQASTEAAAKEYVTETINLLLVFPCYVDGRIENEEDVWINEGPGKDKLEITGRPENTRIAKERILKETLEYTVVKITSDELHKNNHQHSKHLREILFEPIHDIRTRHGVMVGGDDDLEIILYVAGKNSQGISKAKEELIAAIKSVSPLDVRVIDDIDPFFLSPECSTSLAVFLSRIGISNHVSYESFPHKRIVLYDQALNFSTETSVPKEPLEKRLEAVDRKLDAFREMLIGEFTFALAPGQLDIMHGPNGSTLLLLKSKFQEDFGKDTDEVYFNGDFEMDFLHPKGPSSPCEGIHIRGLTTMLPAIEKEFCYVLENASGPGEIITVSVEVPTYLITAIVGYHWSSWRESQRFHEVKLLLNDSKGKISRSTITDKTVTTPVFLKGVHYNVEHVRRELLKQVETLKSETIKRIQVDPMFHKRLVGPEFDSLFEFQEIHNVKMRFPREGLRNPAPRADDEVVLQGQPENIAKAEEAIRECLSLQQKGSIEVKKQVPRLSIEAIVRILGDQIWDNRAGKSFSDFACLGVDYDISVEGEEATLTLYGLKDLVQQAELEVTRALNDEMLTSVHAVEEEVQTSEP